MTHIIKWFGDPKRARCGCTFIWQFTFEHCPQLVHRLLVVSEFELLIVWHVLHNLIVGLIYQLEALFRGIAPACKVSPSQSETTPRLHQARNWSLLAVLVGVVNES